MYLNDRTNNVKNIKAKYANKAIRIEYYMQEEETDYDISKMQYLGEEGTGNGLKMKTEDFWEAAEFELMGGEEYNETFHEHIDFESEYNDPDAKILVIALLPKVTLTVRHLDGVYSSENDFKLLMETARQSKTEDEYNQKVEKMEKDGLFEGNTELIYLSSFGTVYDYVRGIKEKRNLLGMTQSEMAEFLGVPVRTLQNWESGINVPPEYVYSMMKNKINTETFYQKYLFLKRCISFFGNVEDKFKALYDSCNGNMKKFAEELVKSEEHDIIMSHAYAVASKDIDPDGRHWYRVRAMLGNVQKTESDAGGLKIGNDGFTTIISNGEGDGTTRYAIVDDKDFNSSMMNYAGQIEGDNINIYSYDCGNEVIETLQGSYAVYYYSGMIAFEKRS